MKEITVLNRLSALKGRIGVKAGKLNPRVVRVVLPACLAVAWLVLPGFVSLKPGITLAQIPQELVRKLEAGNVHVTRLAPSAFPELPANIRRELERRGCAIPQVWADKKPHNVIKGEFSHKWQPDWAVLCSLNRVSTILVFRNGSEQNPLELARRADIDNLQGVGGDEIGYSRAISAVSRAFILSHYRAYGGPRPPAIDHEGIDDSFVGRASIVYYFHGGQWLDLTGAD